MEPNGQVLQPVEILFIFGKRTPDTPDSMVWGQMVWYGMVWSGMVWYGLVWYGMVWYGMVWYVTWYWYECGMVWVFHSTVPWYWYGAHIPPWNGVPSRYPKSRHWCTLQVPKNGWLKCQRHPHSTTMSCQNLCQVVKCLWWNISIVGAWPPRNLGLCQCPGFKVSAFYHTCLRMGVKTKKMIPCTCGKGQNTLIPFLHLPFQTKWHMISLHSSRRDMILPFLLFVFIPTLQSTYSNNWIRYKGLKCEQHTTPTSSPSSTPCI